jgi:hypothetical protein
MVVVKVNLLGGALLLHLEVKLLRVKAQEIEDLQKFSLLNIVIIV